MLAVVSWLWFAAGGLWVWRCVAPESAWWPKSARTREASQDRQRAKAGLIAVLCFLVGISWALAGSERASDDDDGSPTEAEKAYEQCLEEQRLSQSINGPLALSPEEFCEVHLATDFGD